MIELKGTNIASGIVPFTDQDSYPTHYSQYGKGGYRTVNTLEERDNISQDRLEEGMLVYVINDESNIHTYQYLKDKNGDFKWETAKFTGYSGAPGIPIYDNELINKIGKDKIGDKYVFIPSESDLNGSIENHTYTTTGNGSYVDILFSAIRQLQVEVAKIRNTFKYGLNSYTGTQTALSTQAGEIENPEDEPLWAVEPDMLSMIFGAEVKLDGTTTPSNLEPITSITLHEGKISVNEDGCYWFDNDNLVKNTADSKLFLYLTIGKEDDSELKVEINMLEDESTNAIISQNIVLNLKKYLDTIPNQDKYNILIIISRVTEVGGKNFIWISIGDPIDSKIEGYLNLNTGNLGQYLTEETELDKPYTFSKIDMKNIDLYQLDFYSKYQEFTNNVIPTTPSDNDYKYKVAHLTIRSVDNKKTMESIEEQLQENELIFKEDDGTLWIKMKNRGLVSIAGSSSGPSEDDDNDEIMTIEEIIRELKRLGIIYEDGKPGTWDDDYQNLTPGTGNLKISSISDITFVHQATGKKFNFEVDADGELRSTEISLNDLKTRINKLDKISDYKITGLDNGKQNKSPRGLVARIHCGEDGISAKGDTNDVGLNSDRVRISSFYMPLNTDTVFGCSHAFIELENTSDKDFPLDDCCLYYYHPKKTIVEGIEVEKPTLDKLELKGILPAGSTYLIRGKKYSDSSINPSTFIDVSDFDLEWYLDGELIDLTVIKSTVDKDGEEIKNPYGLALVYDIDRGVPENNKEIKVIESTITEQGSEKKIYAVTNFYYKSTTESDTVKSISNYIYPWYYIDSLPLNDKVPGIDNTGVGAWGEKVIDLKSNTITKNVFALDPAKQALQSLTAVDSSRYRLKNVDEKAKTCDVQYLNLYSPTIRFPHSPEEYPITKFTPKSSKQKRNVITDKTSFDLNKPNCVNCSYGIDSHKTRCFNWVSGGQFDEFVWIKDGESWLKFESYKIGDGDDNLLQSSEYPRKRVFNTSDIELIYSRIHKKFPGCNIYYTSHKCIIDVVESSVDTPTTYTYIVGQADKTGNNPDMNHCSEEYTFTLYPSEGYSPKVYLTTDQQGFNWIEYQVWSASAIELNKQIEQDLSKNNKLIPVLLNSGDMTQNGTRINEWLDYFNGAKPLLRHLEHAAVVGNNDLCGPDPEILGTGDDNGKSNPFYFHVFSCYEIDELSRPIVNNKYVPSNYYFDVNNVRFLMCNSELTITTCNYTFNLLSSSSGRTYNIYTGWEVKNKDNDPGSELIHCSDTANKFKPIYKIIKDILVDSQNKNKYVITVCHEMPFTVITQKCLANAQKERSRSLNEEANLVGSHLNQISPQDTKSLYWFSRLCEQYNVKLVLGGHKHTYACTYPIRENYIYVGDDGTSKTSLTNGPMKMPDSLKNDSISFIDSFGKDLSKFPIIEKKLLPSSNVTNYDNNITNTSSTTFYPCYLVDSDTYSENCVTYFMCQATGYKQTSNKELPSNNQYFSVLIPETTTANKADTEQQYPMYLTVDLVYNEGEITKYQLKLVRLGNIQTVDYLFTQNYYGTENIDKKYAKTKTESNYCDWSSVEENIVTVNVPNNS